jgi:hypothetical protein
MSTGSQELETSAVASDQAVGRDAKRGMGIEHRRHPIRRDANLVARSTRPTILERGLNLPGEDPMTIIEQLPGGE